MFPVYGEKQRKEVIEYTCCSLKCHPSLRPIPQRAARRERRLNSQQRRLTSRKSVILRGDITTLEIQTSLSLCRPFGDSAKRWMTFQTIP